MKLRFSLIFLFVGISILGIALASILFFNQIWELEHAETVAREEARWLSRYLFQAKSDLDEAKRIILSDPPPIGSDFIRDWESVEYQFKLGDRIVIAKKKTAIAGQFLVIWSDYNHSMISEVKEKMMRETAGFSLPCSPNPTLQH